jgi:Zn-dependent protease with chaperone function
MDTSQPSSSAVEPTTLQAGRTNSLDWAALQRGFSRYPRATIVTIIAGWTFLAVALWAALILGIVGWIAGALVGLHVGQSSGTGQATGMLGGIGGFFAGAGIGFALVYGQSIASAGLRIFFALLIGAASGALLTVVAMYVEPWLMYMRGYRPPSRRESVALSPVLDEVAAGMHVGQLPPVLIADSRAIGAWAHPRHIVITRRMLDLPREELAAVFAHEVHHWRSGDAVGLLFVAMCGWPLVIAVDMIQFVRTFAGKFGSLLTLGMLRPFVLISKVMITPVLALDSRRYEYDADAAAVGAGFGPGMLRTLDDIRIFETARSGWETVVNATHPPTEYRIEAVEDDLMKLEHPGAR